MESVFRYDTLLLLFFTSRLVNVHRVHFGFGIGIGIGNGRIPAVGVGHAGNHLEVVRCRSNLKYFGPRVFGGSG